MEGICGLILLLHTDQSVCAPVIRLQRGQRFMARRNAAVLRERPLWLPPTPPQHRPRHLQRGASIRAMTRVLIALIVITFRFLRALSIEYDLSFTGLVSFCRLFYVLRWAAIVCVCVSE